MSYSRLREYVLNANLLICCVTLIPLNKADQLQWCLCMNRFSITGCGRTMKSHNTL